MRVWARAGLLVAALGLALPGAAAAATVSVEEKPFTGGPAGTLAVLEFAAAPGESNQVTVTVATPGSPGAAETLSVLDAGAPLTAGPGCTGGGAPGTAALCSMRAPDAEEGGTPCSPGCRKPDPSTYVEGVFSIDLGDGDDSFDAGSLNAPAPYDYTMQVTGGSGRDRVITGSGADTIIPGPGDDEVDVGTGGGQVLADSGPDGDDRIDLGENGFVSYARRSAPVHLHGRVAGGSGEHDTILGEVVGVEGGSGDDVLRAPDAQLVGGPGDDLLVGGAGANFLFGGSGDDILRGGPGDDELKGERGDDRLFGGSGDDRLDGGPGRDTYSCGTGKDHAGVHPGDSPGDCPAGSGV